MVDKVEYANLFMAHNCIHYYELQLKPHLERYSIRKTRGDSRSNDIILISTIVK